MENKKSQSNIDPKNESDDVVDKKVENIKNENPEEKKETSLEDEIINLKDKIARAYAELENQRRRYEKEKEEAFEYGGFAFAKEALNLLDNLERSKLTLQQDDELKNSSALKKLIDHIDVINKDMISIFNKNNIKSIEAVDKKLDPNLHQAMMEIEEADKEPGTIVQEIQKGFMMKDRLLRPSLVAVSKKKLQNEEKSEENKDKKTKN
tara:strand:+ start:163 stop:786 length:624 start_codon:yes stop_codon:yes gene_type:complete